MARTQAPQWLKQRGLQFLEKHLSGKAIAWQQVIAIIIPVLIDQAFVICLGMLNTAMVSSSGAQAVSAVSMVDSLNVFLQQTFIAIATGGTVVVAQYKGSGNLEMASKSVAQAIVGVAAVAGVISLTILLFHNYVLALLFGRAEADVLDNARIYITACAIAYPFLGIVEATNGALRGAGQTKSALGVSLTMNLTYVSLNVLFITILGMGVRGLAISVICARAFAAAVGLFYLSRGGHGLHLRRENVLHYDFSIQKKILFIGMPFAAEQMFFQGGKLLTQTFVVSLGTLSTAVYAICNSIVMLLQIGAFALNIAVVTVVGQCMGRRDIEDARKFIKAFIIMCSLSYVLLALCILPFLNGIIGLYNPAAEVIPEIKRIVYVTAVVYPVFWAQSFTTPAALRAAGDSRFTSVASLCTMWTIRVILGYVLAIPVGLGVMGVWIGMMSEWVVRGTIFIWRYRGDRWYRHRLID